MRNGLNNFQWCPGCGNYTIHLAIKKALEELNIPKHKVVVVSGIGCSGKMSQYLDGYAAETLHGRAIPFATGVKLSNPDLTVIAYMGDGDCYGIGIQHLMHAAKRNVNIVAIVANNENYGLTTGQASPTTPIGVKTKSTPNGNTIRPFDPQKLVTAAGGNFSKKVSGADIKTLVETLKEAINYDGFAHIDVDQACPSWRRW